MYPYLIDLKQVELPFLGRTDLAVPTYGVLVTLAIVVGFFWYLRNARRDGIDPGKAEAIAFWGVIIGILGGKLGLLAVEWRDFLRDPARLVSLDFLRSAGLVYTAIVGGITAWWLAARHYGVSPARALDAAAIPLPVSQAIGRLGCLAASCCHGGPCDLPWAVTYTSTDANHQSGVQLGVPLHPSQLYEALWCAGVVLPFLLSWRRRTDRAPGELMAVYLGVYGVGRFLVELTRGDAIRGVWFGGLLSTSQLISLLVVPFALVAIVVLRRRAARPGPAGPDAPEGIA